MPRRSVFRLRPRICAAVHLRRTPHFLPLSCGEVSFPAYACQRYATSFPACGGAFAPPCTLRISRIFISHLRCICTTVHPQRTPRVFRLRRICAVLRRLCSMPGSALFPFRQVLARRLRPPAPPCPAPCRLCGRRRGLGAEKLLQAHAVIACRALRRRAEGLLFFVPLLPSACPQLALRGLRHGRKTAWCRRLRLVLYLAPPPLVKPIFLHGVQV